MSRSSQNTSRNPPAARAVSRWIITALSGIGFSGWRRCAGEVRISVSSLSTPWKPRSLEFGLHSMQAEATSTCPGVRDQRIPR